MQQDERRTRRNWMLASVVTGSGLLIAHVDVAQAAPAPGPIADGSITDHITDSTTAGTNGDKTVPVTTQYPAPGAPEKSIPVTTQIPPPTTAPATTETASTETAAPITPTTVLGASDTTAPVVSSTTEPSIGTNDVGTGLAPVPGVTAGAIVAQGGPVLPTATPVTASAADETLPVTGQAMEAPIGAGVALALIGAALLRLRRRPSWD